MVKVRAAQDIDPEHSILMKSPGFDPGGALGEVPVTSTLSVGLGSVETPAAAMLAMCTSN